MGGRGASSGYSFNGKRYGTQYSTIGQYGNIKFVRKNSRDSEPLMETMTKGRVYVLVGNNGPLSISYFDDKGKRKRKIDLDKEHYGVVPHTHEGYFHNEYGTGAKGFRHLTDKERSMVEKVNELWLNELSKKR